MSSNGHRIFGYHYVRKTSTAPATLAINEEQAAVVRSMFEMFASGSYGLVRISRHLEERRVLTSTGGCCLTTNRFRDCAIICLFDGFFIP